MEFKRLIENLPVGILQVPLKETGKIVYANPAAEILLGASPGQLTKYTFAQLFTQKGVYQALVKKMKALGHVARQEVRFKSPCVKSKMRWVNLTATGNKDVKKKQVTFDVMVEDVTLQRQCEKDLKSSKELFQAIFSNTAAAIVVADDNGKVMAWNPFAEGLLGMGTEQLFNKSLETLYPAKEWRRVKALTGRQGKTNKTDIETQLIKENGHSFEAYVSVSELKNNQGKTIGSISIIRDITAQKEAERRIKDSEEKIRVILDNSAAAIMLIDEQGRIVSWNKYTENLLGMQKKDLAFRQVQTLYPKKEWEKIKAEKIRKIGSKHHLETKICVKSGALIDIDLSINVLRDSKNKIIGSVGIMQDITEQKKFQAMLVQSKLAAEEANSAKSLFLANMSHEVRTPMNTIMGMIDLTLDTSLDEEQHENLVVAKDAADNLLGLLNDILDLSRVEAGKITLETIDFHLHNVVKSVRKGLSVIANEKNLELALDIHAKVPELIEGDPVRLRQVLINLINNAIKFTHKGKITTEIKVASQDQETVMLLFSVIDQGVGIPKDRHSKIFNVFTQADDSTTRRFGGTGLGLAISKKLVEMMGGRIWVESEEGQGSAFNFTANFKVVAQTVQGLAQNVGVTEAETTINFSGLRVLLAEDNVVNQKMVVRMMEKQGCLIEAVGDGQAVLDAVHGKKFDVILMDAHMPVYDGLEVTEIIRREEKTTGTHIPIIALTARAMQEDRVRCLEAGMNGYVPKPINRQQLFDEIRTVLKNCEGMDSL